MLMRVDEVTIGREKKARKLSRAIKQHYAQSLKMLA